MVNHLRTLLLNRKGQPDAGGEEVIESSFCPRILNPSQTALRSMVFPGNFPEPYNNFVATAVARMAASTPFSGLIEEIDHRILLSDPTSSGFEPYITIDRRFSANSVTVQGRLRPRIEQGIFSAGWKVQYASSSSITIQDLQTDAVRTETLSFSQNSSTSVLLEEASSLKLRLTDVIAVPLNLYAVVTAVEPMTYSVTDLAERLRFSPAVRRLFTEPGVSSIAALCLDAFDHCGRDDWSIAAAMTAYVYSFEEGS